MAATETHIASLLDPAFFGCVTHGESRKARLAEFSGCDLVIASDSVAMIGSLSSLELAAMWLERRKLISLPITRDWAANDRSGSPREGTGTPPLPCRPFPAPAASEIVPWVPPPPAPSPTSPHAAFRSPRAKEAGVATPVLPDGEPEVTAGCVPILD